MEAYIPTHIKTGVKTDNIYNKFSHNSYYRNHFQKQQYVRSVWIYMKV